MIIVVLLIISFTKLEEISSKRINDTVTELSKDIENSEDTSRTYEINTRCEYLFAVVDHGPVFWDHPYSPESLEKFNAAAVKIYEKYGSTSSQEVKNEIDPLTKKFLQDQPLHYKLNPKLIEKYGGSPGMFLTDADFKEDPKCANLIKTNFKDQIDIVKDESEWKTLQQQKYQQQVQQPIVDQEQTNTFEFQTKKICEQQTSSRDDCAIVLEQAVIENQNAYENLQDAISHWKNMCEDRPKEQCYQEFLVVRDAITNYLDKNEKYLLILFSTDEHRLHFSLLVGEYTQWAQFCESKYVSDAMCADLEIMGKKLDEFNSLTINECADNPNDVCDERILRVFALCSTTPIFENMKICSDPQFENYVSTRKIAT